MPDRTQDLTNHRQVAVACKNYTDSEIKKSEERILSIVARNNVSYIDHTDEATYRFTAPANSKLLMLQSIAGNSVKYAPSTPSDDSVARLKVIPENTYKSQIDYIGGKTVKYNQLVANGNFSENTYWSCTSGTGNISISNNILTYTQTTASGSNRITDNVLGTKLNHKYLAITRIRYLDSFPNNTIFVGSGGYDGYQFSASTIASLNTWYNLNAIFTRNSISGDDKFSIYPRLPNDNDRVEIRYSELIDLTDKFGAGNEPSDVATAVPLLKANGYKLDGTDTYSTGELKHAIVSEVEYSPINLYSYETLYHTNEAVSHLTHLKAGTYTTKTSIDTTNLYIKLFKNGTEIQESGHITPSNYWAFSTTSYWYYNSTQGSTRQFTIDDDYDVAIGTNADTGAKLMLVSGSTAPSTFIPYVAPITKAIPSQVLADTRYGLGFDNTNYNHLDIDGHLRGKYKPKTYSGSEVYGSTGSTYSNIIYYKIRKPLDYVGYGNYSTMTTNVKNTKFEISSPPSFDNSNYIGTINSMAENTAFWIGFAVGTTLEQAQAQIDGLKIVYELNNSFDEDYSQYFTSNWNKVNLDNKYTTCEMVVAEPIDMPNKVEYYGTIIHSLATAVKQDGFNIWDEEWENGRFNPNSGTTETDSKSFRSKNYIPVIPNTMYYEKIGTYTGLTGIVFVFYDTNKNKIGVSVLNLNTTFTTPSNCAYIKFSCATSVTDVVYNNDICINISNQDLNGTYKPYKAPITRLLPNSEAKYSWGITDGVRNTRVFCDDECNPVNEGQLDVETYTFNGNETWYFNSEANREIITTSSTNLGKVGTTNGISDDNLGLQFVTNNYGTDGIYIATANVLTIFFRKYGVITDTASAKHYLIDRTVEYEKATTATETLDDFDFSFDCEEGDTFTIIGCELLQCYATYSFLIKEAKSNE